MTNRVQSLLVELSEETGLSVDSQTRTLCGTNNGYAVCLGPVKRNLEFIPLSIALCRGGTIPDKEELRRFAERMEPMLSCVTQRKRSSVSVRIRVSLSSAERPVLQALEATTAFLRERGYQS